MWHIRCPLGGMLYDKPWDLMNKSEWKSSNNTGIHRDHLVHFIFCFVLFSYIKYPNTGKIYNHFPRKLFYNFCGFANLLYFFFHSSSIDNRGSYFTEKNSSASASLSSSHLQTYSSVAFAPLVFSSLVIVKGMPSCSAIPVFPFVF